MFKPDFGATFKTGVVAARDAATCRVRVQFPDIDGLVSHWLPVAVLGSLKNRHYHLPDEGEHVACLMDARFEDGVVLCAIYSDADAPPVANGDKTHVRFDDGTTVEYDRAAHQLAIHAVGSIAIVATRVTVQAKNVTLDGNLQVTGNIGATGTIMDSGGNSNHHTH